MARLTKQQRKLHNESLDLLCKEKLTFDDKLFVLDNWQESANNDNAFAGAFFTPIGLARDFNLSVTKYGSVIDLCAGIGALSLFIYEAAKYSNEECNITCIELNSSYIEVGKNILPEANWIHGSALDKQLISSLGYFGQSISNPPFGNVKTDVLDEKWLKYKGSDFEFKIIEVASNISEFGSFILPQMSTPYKYSGNNNFYEEKFDNLPQKVKRFVNQTGLEFNFNCGIDTSIYINDWKGVSPMCEIVTFDFSIINKEQLTLF